MYKQGDEISGFIFISTTSVLDFIASTDFQYVICVCTYREKC